MIDIKFLRENPDVVKENIKKKFQDKKLPLVDEVIELDAKSRAAKQEADDLRAKRNQLSKQIGALMKEGKKEEAEAVKAQVAEFAERLTELEEQEKQTLLLSQQLEESTQAKLVFFTNVSHTQSPLPSCGSVPSIWYALVATPHTKSLLNPILFTLLS